MSAIKEYLLAKALQELSNEVLATLPLMEPLARREFGNTNYTILIERAEKARRLLQTTDVLAARSGD